MQAQKTSFFPIEIRDRKPDWMLICMWFFTNFTSAKLRDVMAVDISTSLLFTDNENDTNKQCNIQRDTL